jgi:hypothetical protein
MEAGKSGDIVERSRAWLLSRQAVVEGQQQQQQILFQSQQQRTPFISPTSARIASLQPRSGIEVSTRLFRDAELQKEHKRYLEEASAAAIPAPVPAITKLAAELHREGVITDRLYNESKVIEERKKAAIEARQKEIMLACDRKYASVTGALGASAPLAPNQNSIAKVRKSDVPNSSLISSATLNVPSHTVEDLYQNAMERRKRLEALREKADKEARLLAKPKLNSRSLSLVASMPKEKMEKLYNRNKPVAIKAHEKSSSNFLPPSPSKANHNASSSGMSSTAISPSKNKVALQMTRGGTEEKEFTFHPRLAPRSLAIAARHYGSAGLTKVEDRLYAEHKKTEDRKKDFAKSIAEYEERACTFQPNVDKLAGTKGTSSVQGGHHLVITKKAAAKAFEEQREWLQERERKIIEAQRDLIERELLPCTFKPRLVTSPKRNSAARARRSSISGPTGGLSSLMKDDKAFAKGGRRSSLPGIPTSVFGSNLVHPGHPSTSISQGTTSFIDPSGLRNPNGIDSFIERQKKARELALIKANPPFADGSKWTGKPTHPAPPRVASMLSQGQSLTSSSSSSSSATPAASVKPPPLPQSLNSTSASHSEHHSHIIHSSVHKILSAAAPTTIAAPLSASSISSSSLNVSSKSPSSPSKVPVLKQTTAVTTADDIRARLRELEQKQRPNYPSDLPSSSTSGDSSSSSIKAMTLKSSLSQIVAPPSLRFQTSDPLLARLELMSKAITGTVSR